LPILERSFDEIEDVVHDDVATGGAEIPDILREAGDAVVGSGEDQGGSWDHVMDDLHHGRTFVAAPGLSGQNGDAGVGSASRRQIACRLAQRKVRYAIGKNADLQSGSVDTKRAASAQRAVSQIAFGSNTPLPRDDCSGRREPLRRKKEARKLTANVGSPLFKA